MDKLAALISLNEAKKTIDELIVKVKNNYEEKETDSRKLLIVLLSIIGAFAVIGAVAYVVYRHFSADYMEDYDDIDDLFDEDDEEYDDEEPEVIVSHDDIDD